MGKKVVDQYGTDSNEFARAVAAGMRQGGAGNAEAQAAARKARQDFKNTNGKK